MSLQRRRERYLIIFMWKIYYGKVSNDLEICFVDNVRFGLRAIIPSLVTSAANKAQTLIDKLFSVKGPQTWNSVPKHIKNIDKLELFKVELDKWLSNFPDRPPVHGYVVQNNNSILDWNSSRSL